MKRSSNSMSLASIGLLALSYTPTPAAALSWTVCTKDESGKQVCKDTVPRGARIALALACLAVLILLLTLVVCICRNRRAAAAAEKEYNVEASQVEGPPTIIATEYNPTSGPSRVYSPNGRTSPQPPMFPATVHYQNYHPSASTYQNQTAPVSQAAFLTPTYPFTGHSSGNVPKTAFVSGGFPRAPLAGERLKDRIKERPASVSSLNSIPPPYNNNDRRNGTL